MAFRLLLGWWFDIAVDSRKLASYDLDIGPFSFSFVLIPRRVFYSPDLYQKLVFSPSLGLIQLIKSYKTLDLL